MADWSVEASCSAISELVLKLHERCNLSCDHCYMYEAADQNWRLRPMMMSQATVQRAAARLAQHAADHGLDHVRVVFHGGEPLLVGVDGVEFALRAVRAALADGVRVSFGIQTNGILLDEAFLRLFRDHGVRVGISIDGSRSANDRHRRYANGRSSYDEVVRGINLLARPDNAAIYGGLLCTVDVVNDPLETYESLLSHRPPRVDLLLPHGNWTYPPPGLLERGPGSRQPTPYADWLIAIFDRWYSAPRFETSVRLFASIIDLILGGASDTEAIGPGIPTSIVVETDGTYEGNDALKTAGPDSAATGLNVFDSSIDDVLLHPTIAPGRTGLTALGPVCQACDLVAVCGGGLRAHRFAEGEQFTRPSVYCADLYRLVAHIRARVRADLRERLALARQESR